MGIKKYYLDGEQLIGYWRRATNYAKSPFAKKLHIPFTSQLDIGAEEKSNDCGAACVSMVARAKDRQAKKVTVNEIFSFLQGEDAYLSRNQLMMALNQMFKIKATKETGFTVEQSVDEKRPMIALIRYNPLQIYWDTYGKGRNPHSYYFKGQHFVVPFGYDDDHYYVHDPLWPSGGQYASRKIPKSVFAEAWETAEQAYLSIVTVEAV